MDQRLVSLVLCCLGLGAVLALVSCDGSPAPLLSSDGKVLDSCQAERGLSAERYLVFATSETSFALCNDKLVSTGHLKADWKMRFARILSEYTTGELPGGECALARRAVIEPIRQRTMMAFNKEGGPAYCTWVVEMVEKNHPKLWTRYWRAEEKFDPK